MNAYYNESDHFAAEWLRGLMLGGLIAPGYVDERDIRDVQPVDLAGYDRCHFFAGIAGWDLALQLAEWAGPVWTGSCPCQPFSSAGKGQGFDDTRHLWPAWFRLIRECKPPVVFGEQVSSKDGLAWFDAVSTDLEAEDYAVGAADLCAAGVGAPHIRQRLFFVADSERWSAERRRHDLGSAARDTKGEAQERQRLRDDVGPSIWSTLEWLHCRDGKLRPTKPGLFPLAPRLPGRVGLLRGAGNSIVPQAATEFIAAFMETIA